MYIYILTLSLTQTYIQLETLKIITRVGDSTTARFLMTFLRTAWDCVKVRGNDTDVKLGVAQVSFVGLF